MTNDAVPSTSVNRNVTFQLSEAILSIILSFVQCILLTHYLSVDQVGYFWLMSAWIFLISPLTLASGISSVASREIAQKGAPEIVLTNALILQLIILFISVPILYFVVTLFNPEQLTQQIILWAAMPVLIAIPLGQCEALLVGRERMILLAVVGFLVSLIALVLVTIGLMSNSSIIQICVLANSGVLIYGIALYIFAPLHRYFKLVTLSLRQLLFLFKEALPSLIVFIAMNLYIKLDVLMLNYYLGKEAVALYGGAYLILDNLMVLSGGIIGAVCPTLSRFAVEDRTEFNRLYDKTIKLLTYILLPLIVSVSIFASPLLNLLYGPNYGAAASTLKLLMFAGLFALMNAPSGFVLFSYRKQVLYMWGAVLAAFINIAGNMVLIPRLGINGAALATLFTELFLWGFSVVAIYRTIQHVPLGSGGRFVKLFLSRKQFH